MTVVVLLEPTDDIDNSVPISAIDHAIRAEYPCLGMDNNKLLAV